MFEASAIQCSESGGSPRRGLLDASSVARWTMLLAEPGRALSDAERIDLIHGLEELKCAAEAAQAVVTADFDESQRAEQASRGVPVDRRGAGVAAQVALARRESPHKAQQHVGLARILRDELPHTLAAFRAGKITEWKATLVGRETACLSLEDRRIVDRALASDPARIEAMGDGELVAEVKRQAYRLDPESFVEARRRAEAGRRVTLRPAPDTMTQLSCLLPVKQGVAVYAVLGKHADALIAAGDPRGRGQIMADTLVERVTNPATSETFTSVGVCINVVVSDRVLLGMEEGAAYVDGYGPIPTDLAREMAADADWLRRLYATPGTGDLVAMDSTSERFPSRLAEFLRLRDQVCRTPWCDAPIRHRDHVQARAESGPTAAANGQGLCEACNYAKAAIGWTAWSRPGPRHTVEFMTPTGHRHRSVAPRCHDGDPRRGSSGEFAFSALVLAVRGGILASTSA